MAEAAQKEEFEGARSDVDRLNHPAMMANRYLHRFYSVSCYASRVAFSKRFSMRGRISESLFGSLMIAGTSSLVVARDCKTSSID
jgi:hypothetical protein